jgi:2-polyprenyl-3-methyl-5-hydroxy-6-metoxy-1,4-benzoquinol methylase
MSVKVVGQPPAAEEQRLIDRYFDHEVGAWHDLYEASDVWSRVFQHRQAIALQWIDRLGLAAGAPVLDVGSGAGFLSLQLARRGFAVVAVDAASAMVEATRRHAAEVGMSERVTAQLADAQRLDFPDHHFDLVVALGVLDWVPDPARTISEMARVLRPGGALIASSGNSTALLYLVEPIKNYWLTPLKRGAIALLHRLRRRERIASQKLYPRRRVDRWIKMAGLTKLDCRTVGFGPFTVFYRLVFSESVSGGIHERLQNLADQGTPIVRSAGMSYVVFARKQAGT